MADLPRDAGFSLLEVLVVLAIAAMVATVLTATILRPHAAEQRWATDLSHFLRAARANALRTGTPVVVSLEGEKAQSGAASFTWPAPAATYQVSGGDRTTALVMLDAAGFAISGPVSVTRSGQSWDISQLLGGSGPWS
jgi:type II secretion system protein H